MFFKHEEPHQYHAAARMNAVFIVKEDHFLSKLEFATVFVMPHSKDQEKIEPYGYLT